MEEIQELKKLKEEFNQDKEELLNKAEKFLKKVKKIKSLVNATKEYKLEFRMEMLVVYFDLFISYLSDMRNLGVYKEEIGLSPVSTDLKEKERRFKL